MLWVTGLVKAIDAVRGEKHLRKLEIRGILQKARRFTIQKPTSEKLSKMADTGKVIPGGEIRTVRVRLMNSADA